MKLESLGEFKLIERIAGGSKRMKSIVHGIGDDAAVIETSRAGGYLLFTTDTLLEGVHFLRSSASAYQIGRKAMAVNISDIAAMGGFPLYAVVSLGLPPDLDVTFVDRMYRGMRKIAGTFKVGIVGGDISRSRTLMVNVALIGEVEKKNLVSRGGAKRGDTVFVTGTLGGAVKKKHLRFVPRVREARMLVEHFHPTSMIDISDGLAQDLGHIVKASNAGAVLYEELLPISKSADSLESALSEGEDYELLFTLPPKEVKKLLKTSRGWKVKLSCIGEIAAKEFGITLVNKKGKSRLLQPKGYAHF